MQQQKPQKPLEGAQLVIMTIALSLATFMQVLDSTIANVAIPTIAGNLGSSLSQEPGSLPRSGWQTPSPFRLPAGWRSASVR